jgi:hypothetical protein
VLRTIVREVAFSVNYYDAPIVNIGDRYLRERAFFKLI